MNEHIICENGVGLWPPFLFKPVLYSVSCIKSLIGFTQTVYYSYIVRVVESTKHILCSYRHSKHIVGWSERGWLAAGTFMYACFFFIIIIYADMYLLHVQNWVGTVRVYTTQSGFIHSSGTLDAYDFWKCKYRRRSVSFKAIIGRRTMNWFWFRLRMPLQWILSCCVDISCLPTFYNIM